MFHVDMHKKNERSVKKAKKNAYLNCCRHVTNVFYTGASMNITKTTTFCESCPLEVCPVQVQWQQVRFDPLMKIMTDIHITESAPGSILPEHLHEKGIRQYQLKVSFRDDCVYEDVDERIDKSNIACESVDYSQHIIWGGEIFKRPKHKGYWRLKAPCIYCYGVLAKLYEDDVTSLKKCCVLTYL